MWSAVKTSSKGISLTLAWLGGRQLTDWVWYATPTATPPLSESLVTWIG